MNNTPCPVCTAEYCQQGCRCMCHMSKPVEQLLDCADFVPFPGHVNGWCSSCDLLLVSAKMDENERFICQYCGDLLIFHIPDLIEDYSTALANYAIADAEAKRLQARVDQLEGRLWWRYPELPPEGEWVIVRINGIPQKTPCKIQGEWAYWAEAEADPMPIEQIDGWLPIPLCDEVERLRKESK